MLVSKLYPNWGGFGPAPDDYGGRDNPCTPPDHCRMSPAQFNEAVVVTSAGQVHQYDKPRKMLINGRWHAVTSYVSFGAHNYVARKIVIVLNSKEAACATAESCSNSLA